MNQTNSYSQLHFIYLFIKMLFISENVSMKTHFAKIYKHFIKIERNSLLKSLETFKLYSKMKIILLFLIVLDICLKIRAQISIEPGVGFFKSRTVAVGFDSSEEDLLPIPTRSPPRKPATPPQRQPRGNSRQK